MDYKAHGFYNDTPVVRALMNALCCNLFDGYMGCHSSVIKSLILLP